MCKFCKSESIDDLEKKVNSLLDCNNCNADIILKGEWTGNGWAEWQKIKANFKEVDIKAILSKKKKNVKKNKKSNDIIGTHVFGKLK